MTGVWKWVLIGEKEDTVCRIWKWREGMGGKEEKGWSGGDGESGKEGRLQTW